MIKAIETTYNGYKFRSRLEARWAVFFDNSGVKYEYEYEGYDVIEGGYYLPDFWLPEDNTYIEIKPPLNQKTWKRIKKDSNKWLNLPDSINTKIFVFFGLPFIYDFDCLFSMKIDDYNFRWSFWRPAYFVAMGENMYLTLDISGKKASYITPFCTLVVPAPEDQLYHLTHAYTAARQARFNTETNAPL